MKQLTTLLIVIVVAAFLVTSCSKSSTNNTSTSESAAPMSEASPPPESPGAMATGGGAMMAAAKLPIPLAKLPSMTVAKGDATAGAKVFSANCASCHGEGGKNGQVGPTLAGAGLKAGQVAYMVRNPQGVDKSSGMPKLPLTNKELADVSAYVASLK